MKALITIVLIVGIYLFSVPIVYALAGATGAGAGAAGLGGGGGSGGFVQTGSVVNFDAATAVGFRLACPHASSTGNFAKSTTQPSRL